MSRSAGMRVHIRALQRRKFDATLMDVHLLAKAWSGDYVNDAEQNHVDQLLARIEREVESFRGE